MKRSDLIDALAARFPALTVEDAAISVKEILSVMTATLAEGERIEIRGFGSFTLNYHPPRVGRNPKSGDVVTVPGKYAPHFRAGLELRERVTASLDPTR